MKTSLALGALTLIASPFLIAQDAPKAFQKDAEEVNPFDPNPQPIESTYDHFDPYRSAPKNVRVQLEYIEVDHKTLTRLMMEENSRKMDATPLRMKLQKLIEKGEASIVETSISTARSGEASAVESIHEYIYPTEYDPAPACGPNTLEGQQEREAMKMVAPHLPTAFETRNTGNTFEIEPTIGEDDELVNIRLSPELVWHTGNNSWHEIKDAVGNINRLEMPNIYTARISVALTVVKGQYNLIGVHSPKDNHGKMDPTRKLMLFLKVDVLAAVK